MRTASGIRTRTGPGLGRPALPLAYRGLAPGAGLEPTTSAFKERLRTPNAVPRNESGTGESNSARRFGRAQLYR